MPASRLRLGTRRSALALWQAHYVARELTRLNPGLTVELVEMTTRGDQILDRALSRVGGKGLFTTELENALLENRVDLAVHSFKDLPTAADARLAVVCVPPRAPFEDAFVAPRSCAGQPRRLRDAQAGAVIATGSLRRRAQLLALIPGLEVVDVRGNIDTRLRKLDENDYFGMILARAGLTRLGYNARISEVLALDTMLPAPAQGALAVQARAGDERVRALTAPLHHAETAAAVAAERALLARLEGGCQVPIAAHATVAGETVTLDGFVSSLDGTQKFRAQRSGPKANAAAIGDALAEQLLTAGARAVLEKIRAEQAESDKQA